VRFNNEDGAPIQPPKPKKSKNPLFLQIEALETELEHAREKPFENVYEEFMQ